MKLSKSIDEYEKSRGWSSSLFYPHALELMKYLKAHHIKVDVGRTVIHLGDKIKVYVHHNGRSKEYATVTDWKGHELCTYHYTEVEALKAWIKDYFFEK